MGAALKRKALMQAAGQADESGLFCFRVEQRYNKSNKFIEDFEKIIAFIRCFPEVRDFIREGEDMAIQGK